jgi:hypothetical protein
VTGIRHDAYADAHRIKVVESKSKSDQGRYLQPKLYGQAASEQIGGRALPTGHQPSYKLPKGGE